MDLMNSDVVMLDCVAVTYFILFDQITEINILSNFQVKHKNMKKNIS